MTAGSATDLLDTVAAARLNDQAVPAGNREVRMPDSVPPASVAERRLPVERRQAVPVQQALDLGLAKKNRGRCYVSIEGSLGSLSRDRSYGSR